MFLWYWDLAGPEDYGNQPLVTSQVFPAWPRRDGTPAPRQGAPCPLGDGRCHDHGGPPNQYGPGPHSGYSRKRISCLTGR